MKNLLLISVILILLIGCKGQGEKNKIPRVKYCMELTLVGGTVVKDTFNLYEGTQLEINVYKGAYGLNIVNYYPLYWDGAYSPADAFIRWGVVDYKVTNILK